MLVKVGGVADMGKVAAEVAKDVKNGGVLLLSGPLGSGKTTFVQALAKILGVEVTVASPSYTIAAEYEVKNHGAITKLVHVDLYRLSEDAASDVAVQMVLEEVGEPGRLTVIEWAERLPVKSLRDHGARGRWLHFKHGSTPNERVVTVQTNGEKT